MPTVTINQTTFTFDHVYYVSASGSDAADGSEQAPFLTVDQAVLSCANGGDAIVIGPGVFLTTRIAGTTDSGGVTDYGKSISFFGTPGETVFLCDGNLHTARDHHAIMTYGVGTKFYHIIFEVRTGVRGGGYESALFRGCGPTSACFAAIFNCVFIVNDDCSFLYDNTNTSWVTLSYCSFLTSNHFADSYSGGGRYQLSNCASTAEWPNEYIGTNSVHGCVLTGFYELSGGYNNSHLVIPKQSNSNLVDADGSYDVYYDWKAFDRDRNTRWISTSTSATHFVSYASTAPLAANFYTITPGYFDRAPKTFSLQGFNGSVWETIDTQTNHLTWNHRETKVFVLSQTVSYVGYRLDIQSVHNDVRVELYAFNVGYRSDFDTSKGVYGGDLKWNPTRFVAQTDDEIIVFPMVQSNRFVGQSQSKLLFDRFAYTTAITIEALISTTSLKVSSTAPNPALTIIGDRDSTAAFSFGVTNGRLVYKVYSQWWQTYTGEGRLVNDGIEHHVAVTHGAGFISLYVDGQLVHSAPTTAAANIAPSIIGCGKEYTDYFEGSIREVRVWNVVRTQTELQNHITTSFSGTENGLVAYFPMRSTTTYGDYPSISVQRRWVVGTAYYVQPCYVPLAAKTFTGPLTASLFETYGSPSIRALTSAQISALPETFEIVAWGTDGANLSLAAEGTPLPQVAIQTTDVQFPGVIDGPFTVSPALDASMCRIAMSGDHGVTWKSYVDGGWTTLTELTVDVLYTQAHGMSVAEVNAIPTSALLELGSSYRFAYVLSMSDGIAPALNALTIVVRNTVTTPVLQTVMVSYSEIDARYYGLIFMDDANNVYSLSDGTVLRYFDFGDLTAGQDTLEVPIKIKNGYNFSLTNIQVSQHDLPYGAILELSKTLAPFTPSDELVFTDVMDPDDVYTFYIRLKTDYEASVGGIFALKAKASVVVS